jgi:hypothetical protein
MQTRHCRLSDCAACRPSLWLTDPAGIARLSLQPSPLAANDSAPSRSIRVRVDAARTRQPIEGFGFALTGGSAELLMRMGADARRALLRELFAANGSQVSTCGALTACTPCAPPGLAQMRAGGTHRALA